MLICAHRYSSLEVLFDTLKFHGSAFTTEFWTRIFDSVLLPIFDHVRAEVHPPSPPPNPSLIHGHQPHTLTATQEYYLHNVKKIRANICS